MRLYNTKTTHSLGHIMIAIKSSNGQHIRNLDGWYVNAKPSYLILVSSHIPRWELSPTIGKSGPLLLRPPTQSTHHWSQCMNNNFPRTGHTFSMIPSAMLLSAQ